MDDGVTSRGRRGKGLLKGEELEEWRGEEATPKGGKKNGKAA